MRAEHRKNLELCEPKSEAPLSVEQRSRAIVHGALEVRRRDSQSRFRDRVLYLIREFEALRLANVGWSYEIAALNDGSGVFYGVLNDRFIVVRKRDGALFKGEDFRSLMLLQDFSRLTRIR